MREKKKVFSVIFNLKLSLFHIVGIKNKAKRAVVLPLTKRKFRG